MIGLVYKDLLCLAQKPAASYLFVVAIYGLLTVAGVWDGTILSTVLAVLISMLPYSCFSYDNIAKWELYGLSLPLRRSRIVLARYLTVLLALAFSAVLCGLFGAALAGVGPGEDWVCISAAPSARWASACCSMRFCFLCCTVLAPSGRASSFSACSVRLWPSALRY